MNDITSLFIAYISELHLSSDAIQNTINKGVPSKITMGKLAYELYSENFSKFTDIEEDSDISADHIQLYWNN